MAAKNNVSACVNVKGNRYYFIVSYYIIDSNGKKKREQKSVHTDFIVGENNKRALEHKRIETIREWEEKILFLGGDMLFSDYLKQWLEETKNTIRENTYFGYKNQIHKSICPYFENAKIKLSDLKPYHIQDFYNHKMNVDKVSANTIWHYHANISKALKYAVKTERIKDNPAAKIDLPKKEKHIADYYTVSELKTLIEKAKGTKLETVVLLAAWFGLRRGEIIGLKWEYVDFEGKTLTIAGTVTDKGESGSKIENMKYVPCAKNSSSIRTFPLHDEAIRYLKELKELQQKWARSIYFNNKWDGFVCIQNSGDLISPDYVTKTFPRLCSKCGLKKIKLHELRHTNISLLLENGASMKELQEWAGHSSYTTTANIYSHIQAKSKIKLSQTIESLIG